MTNQERSMYREFKQNMDKYFDYNFYLKYKTICEELFNKFNGLINPMNKCTLSIQPHLVDKEYNGLIDWPNKVVIFLDRIIYEYCDFEPKLRHDAIMTVLFNTVIHELSHADQAITYYRYDTDMNYREEIEEENINRAYEICMVVKESIEMKYGFTFRFDVLHRYHPQYEYETYDQAGFYSNIIVDVLLNIDPVKVDPEFYLSAKASLYHYQDIDVVVTIDGKDFGTLNLRRHSIYNDHWTICNFIKRINERLAHFTLVDRVISVSQRGELFIVSMNVYAKKDDYGNDRNKLADPLNYGSCDPFLAN
jgi:hypothetical protein